MPFYEYECENCRFYTELLQKVTDAPLRKCPSCGKNSMKKLVSAPVFRLKGSGWYETDFKSDTENKRNLAVEKEAESSSDESTPAKAGAASEAKAAEPKPAESKVSGSKPARTGGSAGRASSAVRRSPAPARTAAASRSRAKAPVKSKAKPKPAKRRKSR